jgi:hypothetical protein
MFKKLKDGKLCQCKESKKQSRCHFIFQGPDILDLKLSECIECSEDAGKPVWLLQSSHNSCISYGNTACIFKKIKNSASGCKGL